MKCHVLGKDDIPIPSNLDVKDRNDENIIISSVHGEIQERNSLLSDSSSKRCRELENHSNISRMCSFQKVDNDAAIKSIQKPNTNMFGSGKYVDCLRPFVGLLLSAFGACVMAIAAVMVKRLKSTSVFVILMIRFVVMILMAILVLYFR